jgi:hypothetical protein
MPASLVFTISVYLSDLLFNYLPLLAPFLVLPAFFLTFGHRKRDARPFHPGGLGLVAAGLAGMAGFTVSGKPWQTLANVKWLQIKLAQIG